jgi:TPR repeat protein
MGGYPKVEEKQVYWYRKSAEQGYPKAQNSLGVIYDKGIGVSPDPVRSR